MHLSTNNFINTYTLQLWFFNTPFSSCSITFSLHSLSTDWACVCNFSICFSRFLHISWRCSGSIRCSRSVSTRTRQCNLSNTPFTSFSITCGLRFNRIILFTCVGTFCCFISCWITNSLICSILCCWCSRFLTFYNLS